MFHDEGKLRMLQRLASCNDNIVTVAANGVEKLEDFSGWQRFIGELMVGAACAVTAKGTSEAAGISKIIN
jgi:hypothetical protein